MSNKITVLKIGGSILRDENDLPLAVHEIYRHWRSGSQVLAVVSAFHGTTDRLVERTKIFGDDPHPEALATLLLTGESTSAALLALALERSGIPSKVLSPVQVGIQTVGPPLDAEPVSADLERLRKELSSAVVIVSGFAGTNSNGDLTLLGRGGTDFTALFLARHLNARCILLKDVCGLYESNPARTISQPRQYSSASYATTLQAGGELVQPKAIRFAEEHCQEFEIAAIGETRSTRVGDLDDELIPEVPSQRFPIRVALLGCGTVGGGVHQRLKAMPKFFEVTGVVNLNPEKALAAGVAPRERVEDAWKLIEQDCDVVIELMGGVEPARSLITHALEQGRHVVTANKALIAEDGPFLERLAGQFGKTIRYSGAVGGSLPALETAGRIARTESVRSVSGIINGTCNFICDQLSEGVDFDRAVESAQKKGYAEADPRLDLDGTDAAQKLILLARAAFGMELPFDTINRTGVDAITPADVLEADRLGRAYRVIAKCELTEDGIEARVGPVAFPNSHPFAVTKGADNCLLVESENGNVRFIRGRGAGRFPTTEAVIADLFDLLHDAQRSACHTQHEIYQEVAA